ncbi:DUF3093 family protein [Haloechinothrix halophila]|uniref:DUF3093 family protein n=1 Tax=Haloechinothrix halophila YIM 93223 TaxID=592678 RepID=W9DSV7_9PSEU|nr:DUF3093 family protein [Haloechinothrix halophila]ETA66511.1 hypothetical protein AmyhaDRAFT_0270 [Haloechinothrix halophila YIM 93223]
MTIGTTDVRYEELAASWWALLFGPGFAVAGILFEVLTPGPVLYPVWLIAGLALSGFTAMWVYARKRFAVVRLTPDLLRQGEETLPVDRISAIADEEDEAEDAADAVGSAGGTTGTTGGVPRGSRVLGGGLAPPRKYDELPLRLDDGTVVLAWARDGQALRTALRELLSA